DRQAPRQQHLQQARRRQPASGHSPLPRTRSVAPILTIPNRVRCNLLRPFGRCPADPTGAIIQSVIRTVSGWVAGRNGPRTATTHDVRTGLLRHPRAWTARRQLVGTLRSPPRLALEHWA